MAESTIKVSKRKAVGGRRVKRLRTAGVIPGVVYGFGFDNVSVQFEASDMVKLLHKSSSEHPLIKLKLDKDELDVIVQKIDYHPYKDELVHVDFHKINMDEKISTAIHIDLIGDAKGVMAGGSMELHVRELHVECYPRDLPQFIELDVSDVEIGQSLHVSDIVAPKGVDFTDEPDLLILNVTAPKMEEVEEEVAEGEEAIAVESEDSGNEPELIRKREADEE